MYLNYLTACDPPEEGFAECCFEDDPLFYMITIIDHKLNEEMVSSFVIVCSFKNLIHSHESEVVL